MTIQSKNYTGPDRRRQLPTMELWQENIKSLNQNGLTNCQMRYALNQGQVTFIVRFEDQVPSGKINIVFPAIDHEELARSGWQKFVLTITINDEGRLAIEMWGRYEREQVPLDVKWTFERDIGLGVGIAKDSVQATDARDNQAVEAKLEAIVNDTMKDGERRYSRKDDQITTVSVEGMIMILCRYLKQFAVSRRVIPRG